MTKRYNHLNQEERELIAQYCYEGKSIGFIAKAVGRNKSPISRELSRNASTEYKRYTPCQAHARAEQRWVTVHRRPRLKNDLIRQYVIKNLEEGWSPEQIAGRLPIDHPGQFISHEAMPSADFCLLLPLPLDNGSAYGKPADRPGYCAPTFTPYTCRIYSHAFRMTIGL